MSTPESPHRHQIDTQPDETGKLIMEGTPEYEAAMAGARTAMEWLASPEARQIEIRAEIKRLMDSLDEQGLNLGHATYLNMRDSKEGLASFARDAKVEGTEAYQLLHEAPDAYDDRVVEMQRKAKAHEEAWGEVDYNDRKTIEGIVSEWDGLLEQYGLLQQQPELVDA